MKQKRTFILAIVLFVVLMTAAGLAYKGLQSRGLGKIEEKKAEQPGADDGAEEDLSLEKNKNEAEDFTVYDQDGNKVNLSDMKGKPVVVNFWASWCPPCKAEMPYFEEVYKKYENEVIFMMVDLTDGVSETEENGKKYVEEQGYSFPVYFDLDQEASYKYQIMSIPTTYFIDAEGNIDAYSVGQIQESQLEEKINSLL